jgi:hypothetical protein
LAWPPHTDTIGTDKREGRGEKGAQQQRERERERERKGTATPVSGFGFRKADEQHGL